MCELTIRPAFPDDAVALDRLAQLDCATVPAGALLIAVVDGVAVAALRVADEMSIADPFRPTAELVALLVVRARQLRGAGTRRRDVVGRLSAAAAAMRRRRPLPHER